MNNTFKSSNFHWLYWIALSIPVMAFLAECLVGSACSDADVFRYIGSNMASGGRLYATAWDNKGPLLFLPQYLGYLLCPTGTWAPGFIVMLMWVGIGVFFHKLMLKWTDNKVYSTVALFIMILMASGMDGCANQNSQEPISLFFVLLGLLAATHLSARIGSLFLGCCVAGVFLIKPNLVSFGTACISLWICEFVQERDSRLFLTRTVFSFTGFIGVLLAATGYFALTGRAFALWDATFLFGFFEYGNRDISILEFWQRWIAHRIQDPWGGNHNIWQLPMFVLLFFPSLSGVYRLWATRRKNLSIFFLTWLICEYALTLCMRQFFEHYLVMLCPLTIALTSIAIEPIVERFRLQRPFIILFLGFLTVWYGTYDVGMAFAVHRNNQLDDWKNRIRQWAEENQVKHLITLGSLPSAGILDYLKINSDQKYFAVLMNYGFAKAAWRKREMEDELLKTLRDTNIEWMFSEKPLDEVAQRFSACAEIKHELLNWKMAFTIPTGAFYRRSQ